MKLYDPNDYQIEIIIRENSNIVIGAPHHALGGIKVLPCKTHAMSDENTGFIALRIAEIIGCNCAVVCNMRIDANKDKGSDYYLQLVKWAPKMLIEIHGHGAVALEDKYIEISSGKADSGYSIDFAKFLQDEINSIPGLNGYQANGNYDTVYFKASKTASVIDSRWVTFHIELPPSLRIGPKNELPESGELIAIAIANTINKVCSNTGKELSIGMDRTGSVSYPDRISAVIGPCIAVACYNAKTKNGYLIHESHAASDTTFEGFVRNILLDNSKEDLFFWIAGASAENSDEDTCLEIDREHVINILSSAGLNSDQLSYNWNPGDCELTLNTIYGKCEIRNLS